MVNGPVMNRVFFDKQQRHLACFRTSADSTFWDQHWGDADIARVYNSLYHHNLVVRLTRRYVGPQDGPVLEGGCGMGQFVYCLSRAGYDCIGVDVAERTIRRAQEAMPGLQLFVMDVRKLEFPDDNFAAYWSMGVIEHFPEGYEQILSEMYRVVKPGGYVFLTVPIMSLLRRTKASLGLYEELSDKSGADPGPDFYQYILSHKKIIQDFTHRGFALMRVYNKGGIKGLGDEVPVLKRPLQWVTGLRDKGLFLKGCVKALAMSLSPVANHTQLFVFRKHGRSGGNC